jgi:hypothetical protein
MTLNNSTEFSFLCLITVLKAQAAMSYKHFSQVLVAVTLQNKEVWTAG